MAGPARKRQITVLCACHGMLNFPQTCRVCLGPPVRSAVSGVLFRRRAAGVTPVAARDRAGRGTAPPRPAAGAESAGFPHSPIPVARAGPPGARGRRLHIQFVDWFSRHDYTPRVGHTLSHPRNSGKNLPRSRPASLYAPVALGQTEDSNDNRRAFFGAAPRIFNPRNESVASPVNQNGDAPFYGSSPAFAFNRRPVCLLSGHAPDLL